MSNRPEQTPELPHARAKRHRELLREYLDESDVMSARETCALDRRIVNAAMLRRAALLVAEDIDAALEGGVRNSPDQRRFVDKAIALAKETLI